MVNVEPFEKYAEKYDIWFEENADVYLSELEAVRQLLPCGVGVELGVGSGRFAAPLGLKFGLEPSQRMRQLAERRGIITFEGVAEQTPFEKESFDFALMVTALCFLDDMEEAFHETYRILKQGGFFVNAFIDKESEIGKLYQAHKDEDPFYNVANFYSVEEVFNKLINIGFRDFDFRQTIFQTLDEITGVEPVKRGYGEGSFVVVRAKK
jgi:SAM-dependent methyltransferase